MNKIRRVVGICYASNTALLVLAPTTEERALKIIARIERVAMSATELKDIQSGRISIDQVYGRIHGY